MSVTVHNTQDLDILPEGKFSSVDLSVPNGVHLSTPLKQTKGRTKAKKSKASRAQEAEANARNADNYGAPGKPTMTAETAMKRLFSVETGDGARSSTLMHWRGGWWHWTGTHWVERENYAIRSLLYEWLKDGVYLAPGDEGGFEEKEWNPKRSSIADLLEALAAECMAPDELKIGDRLDGQSAEGVLSIACANGMLEVRGRERKLVPHSPDVFNVTSMGFDYDPEAIAPAWEVFTKSVWGDDRDSILLMEQWLGYVISGETRAQKFLYLRGIRRAGKGTILRLLEKLVGQRNTVGLMMDTFSYTFGMQPLIDKSLAVIPDARDSTRANTAAALEKILMITGDDPVTTPRKNKSEWTGHLSTRIVIAANLDVAFKDVSGALASRVSILPFTRSFEKNPDVDLDDKLAADLSGVLNVALRGLESLQERGWRFVEPSTSLDARQEFTDALSPVSVFVREQCALGAGRQHSKEALHLSHSAWMSERGEKPMSMVWFSRQLLAAFPEITPNRITDPETGQRVRMFDGIAWTGGA